MRTGTGRHQKAILEHLHSSGPAFVTEIVAGDAKRSQRVAMRRAAHSLAAHGRICCGYYCPASWRARGRRLRLWLPDQEAPRVWRQHPSGSEIQAAVLHELASGPRGYLQLRTALSSQFAGVRGRSRRLTSLHGRLCWVQTALYLCPWYSTAFRRAVEHLVDKGAVKAAGRPGSRCGMLRIKGRKT